MHAISLCWSIVPPVCQSTQLRLDVSCSVPGPIQSIRLSSIMRMKGYGGGDFSALFACVKSLFISLLDHYCLSVQSRVVPVPSSFYRVITSVVKTPFFYRHITASSPAPSCYLSSPLHHTLSFNTEGILRRHMQRVGTLSKGTEADHVSTSHFSPSRLCLREKEWSAVLFFVCLCE